MKGISLPAESIIVIVLAIVVLVSLLVFFTDVFNEGRGSVYWTAKQSKSCTEYIKTDPHCNDWASVEESIRSEIGEACFNLGYSGCSETIAAQDDCVQACCKQFCESD